MFCKNHGIHLKKILIANLMMALKYLKVGLNVRNNLKTKKSNLRNMLRC